jgi:uncharacterized delta-60 repeat protein
MKFFGTLLLVGLALLGGTLSANAQWVANYGGGDDAIPTQIKVDSAGNTIVVGTRKTSGQQDILLLKYDTSGALVWATTYAGADGDDDVPADIALDNSDNIYVTGKTFRSITLNDIITLKYNSSGALQWVKIYNGLTNDKDNGVGIKVGSDGNVYVAGVVVRNNFDLVALKYNSSGALQWVTAYNNPSNDTEDCKALALDSSNNVIVVGASNRGGTNGFDYITLKLDNATGAISWVKHYNGTGSGTDVVRAVAVDSSDNVVITGNSSNGSNNDIVTIKYDSAGTTQWAKRYNNGSSDLPTAITTAADGTIYVTGNSRGTGTNFDWVTIKYNASGVSQWTKRTRTAGLDVPNALFVDSSYNVYVAGYVTGNTSGGATGQDGYVVKYNAVGTSTVSARYNGAANMNDIVSAMTVKNGKIYVALQSTTATRNNIVTIQYVP